MNNEQRISNDELFMNEEKSKRKFDLEERLIDFAVLVIRAIESLFNTRAGNHIAGQLIKSGTHPALHYGEAQSADKIDLVEKGTNECNELISIFVKSIETARKNDKAPK